MNEKKPFDWSKLGGFLGDMGGYRMAQSPGRIGRPVGRLGDAESMMIGQGGGAFGPAQTTPQNPLAGLEALLGDENVRRMIGIVETEDLPPVGDEQIEAATEPNEDAMKRKIKGGGLWPRF